MCTQTRHARNEDGNSSHVNRHIRRNKKTMFSKLVDYDQEKTIWNFKSVCQDSSGDYTEVKCLLTKHSASSIKCKHVICLFLAYFAMSTSAEVPVTKIGHTTPSFLQSNQTKSQYISLPNEKISSIPLPEIQRGDKREQKEVPMSEKAKDPKRNRAQINRRPHKDPNTKAESQIKEKHIFEEERSSFTLDLFHRYGNKDYLLKEDLVKIMENIGLSILNQSENILNNHLENLKNFNFSGFESSHQIQEATCGNLSRNGVDDSNLIESKSVSSNSSFIEGIPAENGAEAGNQNLYHHHDEHKKCLSTEELLQLFKYERLKTLTAYHFLNLCPALINQLDAGYCKLEFLARSDHGKQHMDDFSDKHEHDDGDHSHGGEADDGHHNGSAHSHHHEDGDDHHKEHDHNHDQISNSPNEAQSTQKIPVEVWFYALLSVAVISLCSVAGIIVIPNMKRVFYNHILQFLVALAVGAMSGDSLLHLLPHAMMSGSHDQHKHDHHYSESENITDNQDNHHDGALSHRMGLYKGLVALAGVYSFFFLERLFTLFTRSRSSRSEKKQKRSKRYRSGFDKRSQSFDMVSSKLENDGGNTPSCDDMVMVVHPNKALRAYADVSHEAYLHRCDDSIKSPPKTDNTSILLKKEEYAVKEESFTVEGTLSNTGILLRNTAGASDADIVGIMKDVPVHAEPVPTTHSHSHSHLAPDFVGPLSSVAMMVIVGDMIHNFCDGLAIGAAYAESVAGGLSTSVAVFCHELPHEIGDFAVLVRSGLTMKKAVYFNLISSIPCFVGVLIGLGVSNALFITPWIFAGVGGMFLYITLVDLIPEMSSVYAKCGEPWFLHLLLQASGISLGTVIVLIISVYEESLITAFK